MNQSLSDAEVDFEIASGRSLLDPDLLRDAGDQFLSVADDTDKFVGAGESG